MFSSNTTQVAATATQAEAIDFDGTNDYLRRTSDLTGNTTSKTFTFSTWIWQGGSGTSWIYVNSTGVSQRFTVRVVSGTVEVVGTANTGTEILRITAPLVAVSRTATFYHVLISIDLANAANRSIYINDVAQTLNATVYTNAAIPFNQIDHVIAGTQGGSAGDLGRLSNVFLDYTYRDMSITANRRLFVTADLKPAAGQASLNPIMYLPMSDPTAPGVNTGTGGNFTLTGVVARSGRGPNQYNAPYSDLDGSADYLLRTTAPTGVANSKTITFSFCFAPDTFPTAGFVFNFSSNRFNLTLDSSGFLELVAKNASGVDVLRVNTLSPLSLRRNYVVTVSIDLSDTAKRHFYINGQDAVVSGSWSTYTNDLISLTSSTYQVGGASGNAIDGRLGAVWFNTSYIDLSIPANLAKFVSGTGINAKPVDLGATGELPTGTSPLIYLPMYGNNAGKNYGTGGDFTVNSGPYTGARGPNEFWGNKTITTNGYLNRTSALSGVSDGNKFSLSFWFRPGVSGTNASLFSISTSGGTSLRFFVFRTNTNALRVYGRNSAGTIVFDAITTGENENGFLANNNYYVQIGIDLSDTGSRSIYVNGVSMASTTTWTTYNTAGVITFSQVIQAFMTYNSSGTYIDLYNGQLSEFYFATDYINFNLEANRLKFRDAFGNPVNLTQQIEALAIPNPAIYMRFPPTAFGTNYGTGGNFTVNGTITDGGQL